MTKQNRQPDITQLLNIRNTAYDTIIAPRLESSVQYYNLQQYEQSKEYAELTLQADVQAKTLFAKYGISEFQLANFHVDSMREGVVSSIPWHLKDDFMVDVNNYMHAISKRDFHLRLKRYGKLSPPGIVSVLPRYDHYHGLAGFIQQSLPNTASVPKLLRNFMVPSNENFILVTIDLAQADWNWLQALTLAPSMKIASDTHDVYAYIGKRLSANDIVLPRQDVKKFVNSLNYGRKVKGLQREWDIIGYKYDAAKAIELYQEMFPELAVFMRDISRTKWPFVIDRYRRDIDIPLKPPQRAALPAQSGVAAFIKAYMVGIWKLQPSWIPVDVIRDMVIYEIPKSDRAIINENAYTALKIAKAQFNITNAYEGMTALHIKTNGGITL